MQKRTDLAFGLGAALYFLPYVNNKILFPAVVLVSSLLPDARLLFFLNPRSRATKTEKIKFVDKILKNYLVLILMSVFLALFYPIFALPFFIGYSFTLLLDAFSRDGIMLFWPLSKKQISGRVATGGQADNAIFYILLLVDAALLVKLII